MAHAEDTAVKRIGDISTKICEALRQSLPTAPEQYMTVMVPGKVVNFDDYKTDGTSVILPLATELNQAILCDDMPTLSPIQMGPTGRSVARSYANALGKLVPAGTTVGISEGQAMTEDQKCYKQAMKILSAKVPDKQGQSLVELYAEKQTKYTKAVAEKTQAFQDALTRAQANPANRTHKQAREAYDKWVQENARTYRNYVQAAYMDWVIMGKKEEVEYWFSVVDQDSAMARIEKSKEVMRWAVVQDVDGSSEFQKVKLEPSDWANKCLDKMNKGTNQTKTAEWYTWEITRLEKTNSMLELLHKNPPTFAPDQIDTAELDKAQADLGDLMKAFLDARQAYQTTPAKLAKKDATSDEIEQHRVARKKVVDDYEAAEKKLQAQQSVCDKLNLAQLTSKNKTAQNDMFKKMADGGFVTTQIELNKSLIGKYTQDRDALMTAGGESTVIAGLAESMGISKALPEPSLPPVVKDDTQNQAPLGDFFTPITVEVSASSNKQSTYTSATSTAAGASASWGFGLARASVLAKYSNVYSSAMSELVNSSVKISFECMRVDINRPWLRPELFFDDELIPGPNIKISPGPHRLHELMDGKVVNGKSKLLSYSTFPLYPTAFLVACNVVLEISGSTSSLQTYMNTMQSSASASVEYGPFSASAKASHSSSSASSSCQTTASGCRIEIKSPQIIGWVSQIVPALPRVPAAGSTQAKEAAATA
ncbi:hypothetical protein BDV93DRAFT_539470 [Ceratobasidium sp. AG-I]|nr:hypothetical protein BDV93DRAFT_539470 [Ceratobasidium sp. AG-I]